MVLRSPTIGWEWEVLKSYQLDGAKPYARVFANVHGFATEMGDCYVTDLGTQLVDFDREVFTDSADAMRAVFGPAGGAA